MFLPSAHWNSRYSPLSTELIQAWKLEKKEPPFLWMIRAGFQQRTDDTAKQDLELSLTAVMCGSPWSTLVSKSFCCDITYHCNENICNMLGLNSKSLSANTNWQTPQIIQTGIQLSQSKTITQRYTQPSQSKTVTQHYAQLSQSKAVTQHYTQLSQ